MEDYYQQSDDTLDKALQGLSSYVYQVLNINNNRFDSYSYGFEYTDDILPEILFRYPNEQVIPKLQSLLQSLQTITLRKLEKALPDDTDWNNEPISKENERQQLLQGIKNTIQFISNIITKRQQLTKNKPLKLLNYTGNERKLNQFKRELKNYYDETPHFNAIFQGQAPNERINWIMNKYEFRFFMRILFQRLFNKKSVNWIIASNSFTLNNEIVSSSLKGNNADNDVSQEFKTKINTAFDKLLN